MTHDHTHDCATCKQMSVDYQYLQKLADELETANQRLTQAIEDAPHEVFCSILDMYTKRECDCWKSML